ncbi:MAG: hypothetical protein ACO2XZ_00800 [Rickettsiales bacterium]
MPEIKINDRNFNAEIVTAIEAGINKYLANSFKYSPFRLALNLFKNANPKLIYQIREVVQNDINHFMMNISGYDPTIFVAEGALTAKGKQMLKICYNIGIHLLRDQLNVKLAFKALYNHNVRLQIYDYILEVTYRSASRIIHNKN